MTASMIACADCGAPVGVDATSCPTCGRVTVLGALAVPRRWEADAARESGLSDTRASDGAVDAGAPGSGVSGRALDTWSAPGDRTRTVSGPVLPAGPPIAPTGAYGPGERFAAAAAAELAAVAAESPTPRAAVERDRLLLERAVAAGAGIIALGMILPWGQVVIGAPGVGTTLGTIGVMGAWHVLVLLATVGLAALALLGRRIPDRVRLGIAPLVVASYLLGLLWPYLVGPLGGGPGPAVILAGAIVLTGSALVTLLLDRRPTR